LFKEEIVTTFVHVEVVFTGVTAYVALFDMSLAGVPQVYPGSSLSSIKVDDIGLSSFV
jgi:hypothetical protein